MRIPEQEISDPSAMKVEIYGEIAPETREFADGLGLPVTYFPRKCGFNGMFAARSLPK